MKVVENTPVVAAIDNTAVKPGSASKIKQEGVLSNLAKKGANKVKSASAAAISLLSPSKKQATAAATSSPVSADVGIHHELVIEPLLFWGGLLQAPASAHQASHEDDGTGLVVSKSDESTNCDVD